MFFIFMSCTLAGILPKKTQLFLTKVNDKRMFHYKFTSTMLYLLHLEMCINFIPCLQMHAFLKLEFISINNKLADSTKTRN